MHTFYTLIISVFAVVFFILAKKRRARTGAVRTKESVLFLIALATAAIYWLIVLYK